MEASAGPQISGTVRPGHVRDRNAHPGARIYHHISKTHFIDALKAGGLYFKRLTEYSGQDSFEGASPSFMTRAREHQLRSAGLPEQTIQAELERFHEQSEAFSQRYLQFILIHCWYKSERESNLMWRTYGSAESLALVSTFGRLKQEMSGVADVGHVDYIDYDAEPQSFGNPAHRAFWKRMEFESESEVRAVISDPYPRLNDGRVSFEVPEAHRSGRFVQLNLGALIGHIVVSPHSPVYEMRSTNRVFLTASTLTLRLLACFSAPTFNDALRTFNTFLLRPTLHER